jgi:uncharacterized protein (DUF885 family)
MSLVVAQNGVRSAEAHQKLRAFEDDYWNFFQRENPELATQLGEYRYNDRLSDYSLAHAAREKNEASQLLARLKALDTTDASEQDQLDRMLLVRLLEDQLESIRLKNYEMPVDQFNGVQIFFPQIVTFVPLDTVRHYEDYIARLKQIPQRFDELIATLKQGEKDGLLQPKFLLLQVVAQCQSIAAPAGEENPFGGPATRIPSTFSAGDKKRLHDQIVSVIDRQIRPAYRKLQKFIAEEYAPKGRGQPGIWSLPDGDQRYRYAVHVLTTSDMAPQQIHQLGLTQVGEIEAEIAALAKKAEYSDAKAFIQAVRSDPKWMAVSREQILGNYRRYLRQMEPKLPELFGILPKAKLVVTSVPEYMEKESSTQYVSGTPDGSRPGQVWVRTYDPTHYDMIDDESTAYHEGIPGHHMQISIAQELPGVHPFHRSLWYTGYGEGWGLYAERLGKELGFYQDPVSDLGRLDNELLRAVRLVVDTGVHYKRWTRQQMADYFLQHYGQVPDQEIDRYIAWPGQALGYKIGQLKILDLRQRAQTELGVKFDIRAFHDEVLNAGSLPLDLLEARVNAWIARVKAGNAR